ncbi:acyl-CoA-binding domain-containing protein 6 [Cylas formicarius]|uniref:acyl-CoA-binding domain-containing protein 6 n=1 Tax=Cylas formicarius TaxID=197179 RepID=UPI002958CC7C|nr:acyl-CoA-binding domain-containing protein 6 [Cylas formicarius]
MGSTDDYSDLSELGININETDSLTANFNKCAKYLQSLAGSLDSEILLKCYGFYKQGLEGPCNVPKPSWYDMKGKAKWDAWCKLQDMSQNEAKTRYIETIMELSPDFELDQADNKNESWVRVSTMPEERFVGQQVVSDYIRDGDVNKIKDILQSASKPTLDNLDEKGMGLIHYAADIGNSDILSLLLTKGANINQQDSEGQTALHYAVCCGHLDCVKLLLAKGARRDIFDNDGYSAEDVANDTEVKELFSQ